MAKTSFFQTNPEVETYESSLVETSTTLSSNSDKSKSSFYSAANNYEYTVDATNIVTQAQAAQVAAEAAQAAAEAAQTAAELAETNAETAETNAETAETNASAAQTAAEAAQSYAEEWANKDEDSLVSAAAGGDLVDDYSAKHFSLKAEDYSILTAADAVSTAADAIATAADRVQTGLDVVATNADVVTTNADVLLTNADVVSTNADVVTTGNNVTYAAEWAVKAEDSLISVAAGGDGSTDYSALHWAAKAAASAATFTEEYFQDVIGAMVTGNTETLITVTYQDADGTIDFVVDNDLANYDNTTSDFITTSAVAAGYQPLDADLTSWATVTRAAGFDTFVATPTTANFLSLVTDETFVMDTDIGVTVQAYDADTVKYDVAGAFTTDQDFQAQLEISEELIIDGLISPTQITSSQNNYAPTGIGTANVVRVDSDGDYEITGISASQVEGRVLVIQNDGSNLLTLTHNDTGNSTAANCFDLLNDTDFILGAGGAIILMYDGTASRWRQIGGAGSGSGVTQSDTAPTSPTPQDGDFWLRTTDFALFNYYTDVDSSQWVQVGGGGTGTPNIFYADAYPATDATYSLGTSALGWYDIHISDGRFLNWNNGDFTITHYNGGHTYFDGEDDLEYYFSSTSTDSSGTRMWLWNQKVGLADFNEVGRISFVGYDDGGNSFNVYGYMSCIAEDVSSTTEDGKIRLSGITAGSETNWVDVSGSSLRSVTNDALSLGTSTLGWSDLFLASGGVINFANGDCTITHGTNEIQIDGGDLIPETTATWDLGKPTHDWENLYLSSTGDVRWNNGSHVITQEVQLLTLAADDSNAVANSAVRFRVDGSEVCRVTATGLSFDAGSNNLDDYEEGSWTPILATNGTNFSSVTYNNTYRTGTYVKVGSLVYFALGMSTTALTKGSASGDTYITGLPFTAQAGTGGAQSPTMNINACANWVQNPTCGIVTLNNTIIALINQDTHNGATSNHVVADVTAGAGNFFYASGCYRTA